MIQPGRYRAKAANAEMGFTSTGKEQIAIVFDLLDLQGQRLTYYGLFRTEIVGQEKVSQCDRTMEVLRTCGWATDDLSDLSGITDNEVELVVEHEADQNGGTRVRIKWVNAAGSGTGLKTVMPEAQKKTFAQRMKAAAIASRAKAPPAQKPAQGQRQQPPAGAGDAWEPKDEDAPNW